MNSRETDSELLACCLRHMVGIKYSIKKLNPQSWVRNSKLRAKFSSSQKALFELCAEGKFCHWVQMLYVFHEHLQAALSHAESDFLVLAF